MEYDISCVKFNFNSIPNFAKTVNRLVKLFKERIMVKLYTFGNPSYLPSEQLEPIHPAIHVQNPSVFLHVLQLGEQTREQFLP